MITVYTDGACEPNPGGGGWAMVAYDAGREIHFEIGGEEETTNNRMEFMGILRALEWLQTTGQAGTVYSDSQYCVKCLTIWWQKWAKKGWKKSGGPIKNLDLIRACLDAMGSAQLKWVKGHAGIRGNERADALASKGRQTVLDKRTAL